MTTTELSALPSGSALVHIGLPKTGSTSIQYGLHHRRAEVAAQGVLIPGGAAHHRVQMRKLREGHDLSGSPLVRTLRKGAFERAFVTDETLATFAEDVPRRVQELVGDKSHVVVVLRDVASLLPSLWQQDVKKGDARTLPEWLDACRADRRVKNMFGLGGEVDVVTRWSDQFGAENVTAVILERSAPERLIRTFEQLLGLTEGTVAAGELNRGLTAPEIEVIRRANELMAAGPTIPARYVRDLLHYGAAGGLLGRALPAGEPKAVLPQEYTELAVELGDNVASALAATGVSVVGAPAALSKTPSGGRELPATDPAVLEEIASAALYGLLRTAAERLAAAEDRKGPGGLRAGRKGAGPAATDELEDELDQEKSDA